MASQRAQGNYANHLRNNGRQALHEPGSRWSLQDARANTAHTRSTPAYNSRANNWNQNSRGMGLATGVTANPFNPATFNFSSRAEPDHQPRQEVLLQQQEQHGYPSFPNPMWAVNGNAESKYAANQDTQHHEDD